MNNGTVAVRQTLYTCDGLYPEEIEQYQTISAQPDCASFSLEELRLADYKQGHGSAPTERDDHLALHFAQTLHLSPRTDDKKHSSHLSLYENRQYPFVITLLIKIVLLVQQSRFESAPHLLRINPSKNLSAGSYLSVSSRTTRRFLRLLAIGISRNVATT